MTCSHFLLIVLLTAAACKERSSRPTPGVEWLAEDEIYVAFPANDAGWEPLFNLPAATVPAIQGEAGRISLVVLPQTGKSLNLTGSTNPMLLRTMATDVAARMLPDTFKPSAMIRAASAPPIDAGVSLPSKSSPSVAEQGWQSASTKDAVNDAMREKLATNPLGLDPELIPPGKKIEDLDEWDDLPSKDKYKDNEPHYKELEKKWHDYFGKLEEYKYFSDFSIEATLKLSVDSKTVQDMLQNDRFTKVVKARKAVLDNIISRALSFESDRRIFPRTGGTEGIKQMRTKWYDNLPKEYAGGGSTVVTRFDYVNPRASKLGEKKALILYMDPKADHNGALNKPKIETLYALHFEHSVRFRRVSSIDDMKREIAEYGNEGLDALIIGGHGSQRSLILSKDHEITMDTPAAELSFLSKVKPGGTVLLTACLVGSAQRKLGSLSHTNLVEHLSSAAPGRIVVGATRAITEVDSDVKSLSPFTFGMESDGHNITFQSYRDPPAFDFRESIQKEAPRIDGDIDPQQIYDFEIEAWRMGTADERLAFISEYKDLYGRETRQGFDRLGPSDRTFHIGNSWLDYASWDLRYLSNRLKSLTDSVVNTKSSHPAYLKISVDGYEGAAFADGPFDWSIFDSNRFSGIVFRYLTPVAPAAEINRLAQHVESLDSKSQSGYRTMESIEFSNKPYNTSEFQAAKKRLTDAYQAKGWAPPKCCESQTMTP